MSDPPECPECGSFHVEPGFCPANPVRKQIRDLVARGNVTLEENESIRCNSYEREALIPVLTDEAFCKTMQYALNNCSVLVHRRPFSTYDEAVIGLHAPELLKRFQRVRDLIVEIRSGMPDDVVVTGALVTVGEIIDAAFVNCQACSIEAEIGTEENPHPIPSRFHTCPPTYENAEFGVHIFSGPDGFKPLYERNSDGNINNCALANGDKRENCQVCKEQCPDRNRFR
jgi:hypothetical protein